MYYLCLRENIDTTDIPATKWHGLSIVTGRPDRIVTYENDEFLEKFRNRNLKILVLMHGYNNTYRDVLETYDNIYNRSNNNILLNGNPYYDLIVGVLWAGADRGSEYSDAILNCNKSYNLLIDFLNKLQVTNDSIAIDVLAHSMGNRLLYYAIQNINNNFEIKNVFSLAPAIPIKEFVLIAPALQSHNIKFHIITSSNDAIITNIFMIYHFDKALGCPLNTSDHIKLQEYDNMINYIDATEEVGGHSEYKNSDKVFKYISDVCNNDLINHGNRYRVTMNNRYYIL